MGRHSIRPAPSAPSTAVPPLEPITDPVLLDAVQRELRRPPGAASPPDRADAPVTRRVETPFSGAVDVPAAEPDGWERGASAAPVPTRHRPRPAAPIAAPSPPPEAALAPPPRPVAARTVSAPTSAGPAGPVIVPTLLPAPVPAGGAEEEVPQGPIGVSPRTLLLSTGVGLLTATALSLLALLPR